MIGFYDYTVILTYISFMSSVLGIFCAVTGHFKIAVACLAFSGLCDMFDGKVARTKKDRTKDEQNFGIQIDSLCDVVCFGVFPIVLCYQLGMNHIYSVVILVCYGLAGIIRLAYFNVMEAKRQEEEVGNRKYYQGMPITSIAVILPLLFVVSLMFPEYDWFLTALHIMMAVVGFLFVFRFNFRKPTNKELVVLVVMVAIAVFLIFFCDKSWMTWKFTRPLFRFGL